MNNNLVGKHVLLECAGTQAQLNIDDMRELITVAASKAGATPITSKFHHFGEGMGITGVLILAESHITVHTWPENNYAAFDFFMCGQCDPEIAAEVVISYDKNTHYKRTTINRQRPITTEQITRS